MRAILKVILLMTASLCEASFSFQDLQSLLEKKPIQSLEELLKVLPEDTKSNYVLLYQSRSLHEASFANPRVLLFQKSGQFVMSFNGSPEQRGFQALEVMQFNGAQKKFEFHEIRWDEITKKPKVSEVNPAACLHCHGDPARALWDTPPLWPGVYGETYNAGLTETEKQGLQKFLLEQSQHPRYKFLKNVERFADFKSFQQKADAFYTSFGKEPPNQEFSRWIAEFNLQKIASEVRSSTSYTKSRFAILLSLMAGCEKEVFLSLPNPIKNKIMPYWAQFQKTAIERNIQQTLFKIKRALPDTRFQSTAVTEVESLDAFRFLAEKLLHLETQYWTTAFEKDTFDFSSPQGSQKTLLKLLQVDVKSADEKIDLLETSVDKICLQLRKKSLVALEGFQLHDQEIRGVSEFKPTMLSTCVACHDNGNVGPALPFSDPQLLKERLSQGNFKRGTLFDEIRFRLSPDSGADRMPRGINLSEEDRQQLESFFQRLADPREP